MPNNTLLLLGLGLAAWTLFRNTQQETGETDLVTASMLSQDTGSTGKALGSMEVVHAETAINSDGAVQTGVGFDFAKWLNSLVGQPGAIGANGSFGVDGAVNTDTLNNTVGAEHKATVSPFVQSPEYIRTTGGLAGTAVRQYGLTRGVDVLNNKIYLEQIQVDDNGSIPRIEGPLTSSETIEIVAGGAQPGDPYFTTFDVIVAAGLEGYFNEPTESGQIASARSNIFDAEASARYEASQISEPINPTGGPVFNVIAEPPYLPGGHLVDRYDVDTGAEF